jgi:RNA polymerase sigma-70 factor (ECF subfamily)
MMNQSASDRWVAVLRRGSREAFERIYAAERKPIYGFLLRLCRDRDVTADLFQNVWLKLARSATELRTDTNIRAWLFTVARNEYRSYCRAQMLDMSRLLLLGRDQPDPLAVEASGTQALAIESALLALADVDREVLLMVAVDGLESQEVAAALGISYAALRQRLARARKRLLEQLERDDLRALARSVE